MGTGDVWFFDRIARVYDLVMPPAGRELQDALTRAEGPVDLVVDFGGGTGRAARAVDAPERIVVDASLGMLRRVPVDIDRVRADASRLPIRGGSVDAITIVDALHHLPRPDQVLEDAATALRPGGVLAIRDFDPTTLRGRLLATGERLLGMGSTFVPADPLADRLAAVGLDADVVERGFTYTVVGCKPGGP